jgi:hypothetical protein
VSIAVLADRAVPTYGIPPAVVAVLVAVALLALFGNRITRWVRRRRLRTIARRAWAGRGGTSAMHSRERTEVGREPDEE